jgi:hypothetical protein
MRAYSTKIWVSQVFSSPQGYERPFIVSNAEEQKNSYLLAVSGWCGKAAQPLTAGCQRDER